MVMPHGVLDQCRRQHVEPVREQLGTANCELTLRLRSHRGDGSEPVPWLSDVGRQRRHQTGEAVAVGPEGRARLLHSHRHSRHQRPRRQSAPGLEVGPQGPGNDRHSYVVDARAGHLLDQAYRREGQ